MAKQGNESDLVEHVFASQDEIGESPRWDAGAQVIYWADIGAAGKAHSFRPAPGGGEHRAFDVGLPITGWAVRESGGFVLATKKGLYFWDPATGAHRFINDPEAGKPTVRFNDGSADRGGRYWAGSTNEADQNLRDGSLYRLDPDDLSVHHMDSDLACSNGLGWSPDNRTMYLTGQFAWEIYAYDFDLASGTIANRRIFATIPREDGLPDGLTVDSEGGVWSAQWGGWRVTRYDPTGKIERIVRFPVPNPTSCVFGGKDLTELYVTTAWFLLSDEERRAQPGSGDLWRVHTGIKGLPEPKFRG